VRNRWPCWPRSALPAPCVACRVWRASPRPPGGSAHAGWMRRWPDPGLIERELECKLLNPVIRSPHGRIGVPQWPHPACETSPQVRDRRADRLAAPRCAVSIDVAHRWHRSDMQQAYMRCSGASVCGSVSGSREHLTSSVELEAQHCSRQCRPGDAWCDHTSLPPPCHGRGHAGALDRGRR